MHGASSVGAYTTAAGRPESGVNFLWSAAALGGSSVGGGPSTVEPDCLGSGGCAGGGYAAAVEKKDVQASAKNGGGKGAEGKMGGEKRKRRSECGCAGVDEDEERRWVERRAAGFARDLGLAHTIVESLPEEERAPFMNELARMANLGWDRLVPRAPPALSPVDRLRGPLKPVIESLVYVTAKIAATVKEGSRSRIQLALQRTVNARKLNGWRRSYSPAALRHHDQDPDRLQKLPSADTCYGFMVQTRNNVLHKDACRWLRALGTDYLLGWVLVGVRQLGIDLPKADIAIYECLTPADVSPSYDYIADSAQFHPTMAAHVEALEKYTYQGPVYEVIRTLRELRLPDEMECVIWK